MAQFAEPEEEIEELAPSDDAQINYADEVRQLVHDEFMNFQNELLKKEPYEAFQKNHEIYVKTEFLDTIEGYDFDEEYHQRERENRSFLHIITL